MTHPAVKDAPASDPQTYPDEAGFHVRANLITVGVATVDPIRWRQGWFLVPVTENSVTDAAGRTLTMGFNPAEGSDAHGNQLATVTIDGQPVDPRKWPIYSGPFVTQKPGAITITDGTDGYTVDFTGDLPTYKRK